MNNPIIKTKHATIYAGSNLDVLPTLADNSVDSIVCDPPYELGFMSKAWDSTGIAYSVELWRECLRVLKPGGHLLAFGGTRTWHRLAVAVEDAGFEIRDSIAWLYGSGFPKSHNISKAIDKAAGIEREITEWKSTPFKINTGAAEAEYAQLQSISMDENGYRTTPISEPATDAAKRWDGWGTALKPAHEPIVVARKPLTGTVAENVLQYGVGGLNVDACRIALDGTENLNAVQNGNIYGANGIYGEAQQKETTSTYKPDGRWPANIILDEFTAELLDEQTAELKGATSRTMRNDRTPFTTGDGQLETSEVYGDTGGASRFFYVAKASKRDRNEGLDELPDQILTGRDEGQDERQVPYKTRSNPVKNIHPTVKPTLLMQYLIRLVTPENGVVLDPFCGSGSTGKAAILENKTFIGIEITEDYLDIIRGRIEHAEQTLLDKAGDLFE